MPRYDYRCEQGHTTEHLCAMSDVGPTRPCLVCGGPAARLYSPPAAVLYKGPGFYATDVKGRLHRRRRKNPGDDLYVPFDREAAAISRAI